MSNDKKVCNAIQKGRNNAPRADAVKSITFHLAMERKKDLALHLQNCFVFLKLFQI